MKKMFSVRINTDILASIKEFIRFEPDMDNSVFIERAAKLFLATHPYNNTKDIKRICHKACCS